MKGLSCFLPPESFLPWSSHYGLFVIRLSLWEGFLDLPFKNSYPYCQNSMSTVYFPYNIFPTENPVCIIIKYNNHYFIHKNIFLGRSYVEVDSRVLIYTSSRGTTSYNPFHCQNCTSLDIKYILKSTKLWYVVYTRRLTCTSRSRHSLHPVEFCFQILNRLCLKSTSLPPPPIACSPHHTRCCA